MHRIIGNRKIYSGFVRHVLRNLCAPSWQSTTAQSQLASYYLRWCWKIAYKSHHSQTCRIKEDGNSYFICRVVSSRCDIELLAGKRTKRQRWLFITWITENWNDFFLASLCWNHEIIFFLCGACRFIRLVFPPFFDAQHASKCTYLLLSESLALPDDQNFSNNIMQPLQHHNLLAKFIYCWFGWQTKPSFAVFFCLVVHPWRRREPEREKRKMP